MIRRLPAPWQVQETPGGYVVRDSSGQALGYFYGHATRQEAEIAKGLTRDEARRMAVNFARLPNLLGGNNMRERGRLP
jgi:hypothetical protein